MSKQERITTATVQTAINQLGGITLVAKEYGDGVTCGCPITILALADGIKPEDSESLDVFNEIVIDWANSKYGTDYAFNFIRGFDYISGPDPNSDPHVAAQGYADGAACRLAFLPHTEPIDD